MPCTWQQTIVVHRVAAITREAFACEHGNPTTEAQRYNIYVTACLRVFSRLKLCFIVNNLSPCLMVFLITLNKTEILFRIKCLGVPIIVLLILKGVVFSFLF